MKSPLTIVSMGYLGQRRSAVSGTYLLGNGYRSFNPIIRRFNQWDRASPFGGGGAHGYGYCSGDPVNQADSSGQGPFLDLLIGLGAAIGRNARRAGVADAGAATAEAGVDAGVEAGADVAGGVGNDFELFRTDDRDWSTLEGVGGFSAWDPLTSDQAIAYMDYFCEDTDALSKLSAKAKTNIEKSFIPTDAKGVVSGSFNVLAKRRPIDLRTHINYTRDATTAWISTGVDRGTGGKSGKHLYRINVQLKEYIFDARTKKLKPGKGGGVQPSFLVGGTTTDRIIAIRQSSEEITFFTSIPMRFITQIV